MNSPNVNNDVALRCVALPTAGRQTANIPRVDLASMQLARSRLDRAKFSPQKEDQMNDRGHHPAKVGEGDRADYRGHSFSGVASA